MALTYGWGPSACSGQISRQRPRNAKPPGAAPTVSAFPLRTRPTVIPGALSAQTVGICHDTVNVAAHDDVDADVDDAGITVDDMWTVLAVCGDDVCMTRGPATGTRPATWAFIGGMAVYRNSVRRRRSHRGHSTVL